MMKIDRFEDVEIWKEARELAKFIFAECVPRWRGGVLAKGKQGEELL